MPKIKTCRAAAKRFKKTDTGATVDITIAAAAVTLMIFFRFFIINPPYILSVLSSLLRLIRLASVTIHSTRYIIFTRFRKFIYYVEELKSNKKPTGFPAGFGFH